MQIALVRLVNTSANFKSAAMNTNPVSLNLRTAFAQWKISVQQAQALFEPYKRHQVSSGLAGMTAALQRLRTQSLRSSFWDLKCHTDDLKKNSIATLLLGGAADPVPHRSALDLARLDLGQKSTILARLLEPYADGPQGRKSQLRRGFLDWKVKA